MDKLICPICGEPTRVYMGNARKDRLCAKHADQLKDGEIEFKNGKFYYTDDGKPIKTTNNNSKTKKEEDDEIDDWYYVDDIKCLICGKPSNGMHFCKSCYYKYKDRSVDIRITNCHDVEILDEYGNKKYTCDDGRTVRSRAEMILCNWFYNNKVRVKYEEPVYYIDEKTGETKTLHPDFYLPDYNIYIEYNELTNPSYLESKKFTKKIYDEKGLDVIIVTDKELDNIGAYLKGTLFTLTKGKFQ